MLKGFTCLYLRELTILAICFIIVPPVSAANSPIQEQIRQKIEKLRNDNQLSISGAEIASKKVLPELYERRSYTAAWDNPVRIDDLIQMVGRAEEEGLLPHDYHYSELSSLRDTNSNDASDIADLDILLTDSLIRYGYHQNFGKVIPSELDSNWNFTRNIGDKDPVSLVQGAIDSDGIRQYISDVLERGPYYRRLKKLLAEYRMRAASEEADIPTIPAGPALKKGMNDSRVSIVRKRLISTGDLSDSDVLDPNLFDETLEGAVKQFQKNANIAIDGIVGPGTLALLNPTLQSRIDQLRVNMERIRWIFRDIRDNKDFVIVNIADFKTAFVRDHKVVWETKSQVGRTYYKTPVFRADMEYAQFNPTWTIPPGILRRDIIPKIKVDPGSLAANDMRLIDNKTGKVVDPATLDWSKLEGKGFPYQVVQAPGPKNPLGLVKFIFPNPHFVYLHDTTAKDKFSEDVRAFSAGCIRIQKPFEFAELLLNDPEWNQTTIQKTLDSKKIKTVYLKEKIPVLVLYWTVVATNEHEARFLPDIYERDLAILKELNEPFKPFKLKGVTH